ncbi:MAG: hypothetical protein AB8G22_04225 [Saprospiraceae bacterium]
MKKLSFLFIGVLSTLFFACSTSDEILVDVNGFRLNEPFQLAYEEASTCECNADFSITFSDLLEDSTCPPTVECIWEGGIKVETTIQLPEPAIVELFRGANLEQDYIGQIDTIGNYIINIVNAEREEAERDNPEAYTVELLVTEL